MTTDAERFEETFAVGQPAQLTVANIVGSITVESDERDDIHIAAVKRLEGCHEPERTEIELNQEGDHVVARTLFRGENRWRGLGRQTQACAVDYAIRVPTHCDVEIHQVSGTVRANGVNDHITVNAVEGAVELCEIAGRAQIKAVSATVNGNNWRGQARVDTVSGAVKVGRAELSRVKANTISGDLSFETSVAENGRYDFHSVSGDVTLCLHPEEGVDSQGTTISGHLVCDLPHEFTRRTRGSWRAKVNGGGPPVRFTSVSGDLELLSSDEPAP
jgi:hypothetical protein